MSTIQEEPGIGDISPIAAQGVETEPMLLLDTTGSMTWSNTGPEQSTPPSRWSVLSESLGDIVTILGEKDSQAEKEKAAGEDAGGLMTVTFAGGAAECIDDLSPENWQTKLGDVERRLGGGTLIMPGWNTLVETYLEEFGETPALDRPKMAALVITDGEANDTDEFAAEMAKVKNRAYVALAIMGYGPEHDRAFEVYKKVAETNDHIRVVSFGNTTSSESITKAVISLLG